MNGNSQSIQLWSESVWMFSHTIIRKRKISLSKNMSATSQGYQELKLIIIQLSHNDDYDSNTNYTSNIGEGEKVNTT